MKVEKENKAIAAIIKKNEEIISDYAREIQDGLKAALPERYTEDIEEILSAARAPKEDGHGYLYPVRVGRLFANAFMTNGRKAVLSLIENRGLDGLVYR